MPHPWFWGEGHTRWRERGWESPSSNEGTHTLVLFIYMYFLQHTIPAALHKFVAFIRTAYHFSDIWRACDALMFPLELRDGGGGASWASFTVCLLVYTQDGGIVQNKIKAKLHRNMRTEQS